MSKVRQRRVHTEDKADEGVKPTVTRSRRNKCKICCLSSVGALLIAGGILIVWPSPIYPADVRLPLLPHTPSTDGDPSLSNAAHLFENEIEGPEGFAVDDNGYVYTGLADGRIVRFKDNKTFTTVARAGFLPPNGNSIGCGSLAQEPRCGRPLGMQFHPKNPTHLYVIDAYHGILRLDTRLAKMEMILNVSLSLGSGEPPTKLVNDLVVLANGSIFFTDSSSKYHRNQVMNEVLEGGANGRLFHFNLLDKSVTVVARGLHFPNGLCLSYDGEFLLVSETTRARILKFPLNGDVKGKMQIFTSSLPGLPDNISPSSSGGYWVGIAASRNQGGLDRLYNSKHFRSFVAKLTSWVDISSLLRVESMIVELDKNGEIIRVLRDTSSPLKIDSVSEVLDRGRVLYLGSFQAPYVGSLHL